MMARNLKDNYFETLQRVRQMIVSHAPLGLRDYDKRNLLMEIEQNDFENSYITCEFERLGTNVHFYVKFDKDIKFSAERPTDDKGNEYIVSQLNVEVSWPCHGSTDPLLALARLNFYNEVSTFAAEVASEFGRRDIVRLYRSAEEVVQQKAEAARARVQHKLSDMVKANRAHMRVGSFKEIPFIFFSGEVQGIPYGDVKIEPGEYKVAIGENNGDVKNYVIRVSGAGGSMMRTS